MTEQTEKKVREKAPFVVQLGENGVFVDSDIDTVDCRSVMECIKAIKAKGEAGTFRIIQVKQTVTLTKATVEKISIE